MLGGEAAADSGEVTKGSSKETRSGRYTPESKISSVSPEFAKEEQSCVSKRRYPEDRCGNTGGKPAGSEAVRESKPKWRGAQRRPPVCQFFLTSGCKYGDRCRFYHPRPRANKRSTTESDVTSPHPPVSDSPVTPYPVDKTEHRSDATYLCPERQRERDGEEKTTSKSLESSVLDTTTYPSLKQQGVGVRKVPTPQPLTPQTPPSEQQKSVPRGERRRGPSELSLEAFFQRGRVLQPWKPVSRPKPKKGNTTTELREVG